MSLSESFFGIKSRSEALRMLAINAEKVQKRPPGVGLTDLEAFGGRTLMKDFEIDNHQINLELGRRESLRTAFSNN